jgi:hypothetical protein
MIKLSSAAQAVLDAAINVAESPDVEAIAAAVLYAAADELEYSSLHMENVYFPEDERLLVNADSLREIGDELKTYGQR